LTAYSIPGSISTSYPAYFRQRVSESFHVAVFDKSSKIVALTEFLTADSHNLVSVRRMLQIIGSEDRSRPV
jgi:hypothetical protein